MTPEAFRVLRQAEDSWWYDARRAVVRRALRAAPPQKGAVLDFGAGYGGMMELLAAFGPVTGYEPSAEAATVCRTRGYVRVLESLEQLQQERNAFALCGAFDVLEHLEDDRAALREIAACLQPGGVFVATVPSYPKLWGPHDESHQHFRRYTVSTLRTVLTDAGFRVVYIGYWNAALFLPFVLTRLLRRGGEGSLHLPHILQLLLSGIVQAESLLIPHVSFPFGSSIVCVAVKS